MDLETALEFLGLDVSANPEDVESAHRRIAAELEKREKNAATEELRSECRAARDELSRAVATVRAKGLAGRASGHPRAADERQMTGPRNGVEATSVAPEDRQYLPEDRVLANRFEVGRRIDTDALGFVHAAFDRQQDREIAVRVFRPGILESEGVRESFLEEMKAARDLSHPGIAKVLEVARDGELDFITMELSAGTTLRREMEAHLTAGHRFSVDEVIHIGTALCDALACAHERLIHGGIKPESVLLCDDGAVKLEDFGLHHLLAVNVSTKVGVPVRTLSYLAPEQLKGSKRIDHRADQYSTAAILYEMLTGEAPVGRVEAVHDKEPDVPRPLSRALDRALASQPADRFPDMSAFARALASGAAARAGRTWPRVAVVAILLIAVAGATFPRWRGAVSSIVSQALRNPEALKRAETARARALASASTWRKVAGLLPAELVTEEMDRADESFSAGNSHFEVMDYGQAEKAFLEAHDLYESQAATATTLLRDEPLRIGRIVRDLFDGLEASEHELYARVAESASSVESCRENVRNARTDQERAATETRLKAAETELDLLSRLRTLTQAHAFSPALRSPIRSVLIQGDRQLEQGRRREALTSYAECKARLEDLLAWPDRAESALRERNAISKEINRLRSALGAAALELEGVRSVFDTAMAKMTQGDERLAAGRVPDGVALFESAREHLSDVRLKAAAGLLLQAQTFEAEGKPSAAALVLNELLALDPNHAQGEQLRAKILSYRMTNSIGMELVFIPPGEFTMGSPADEPGRDEDESQRSVEITSGFYMSATEVTQAQWTAVMEDNPSRWEDDDLPVEQIAWEEALEFCSRLGNSEGRTYRLPTEEEWEYACRAGTTTPFSLGETISTDQANYDGDYTYANGVKGVFRNSTVPVGSFPPNAWGLYDMHGNVWEWCPDSRTDYPPSLVTTPVDEAPIEGRVLRGGSWRSRPRYCRCANRVRNTEGGRLNNIGLRVVVESE